MSYSKQFDSLLNDICQTIATKFNLNKDEVYSALQVDSTKKIVKKSSRESSEDDTASVKSDKSTKSVEETISLEKIMNPSTTKDYLMAFCKSKGLKQSGKKDEIVQRILEYLKTQSGGSVTATVPKVSTKTTSKTTKTTTPVVIANVAEKAGVNEIRKNKFGNYEHFESGLVFVKDSNIAIGHQNNDTGKVDTLTDRDIEMCKKFKFQYKIPANLTSDKGLDNVKVDELDDDEDDEELDEDDLEEEEELEDEIDLEDE
jgi:hypothetical protein